MPSISYALPNGQELRLIRGSWSPQGTWYSAIWFDADANVLGDTDSTLYMDYCRPEVALHELHKCGAPDSLQETFADWHPCECDDDDEWAAE